MVFEQIDRKVGLAAVILVVVSVTLIFMIIIQRQAAFNQKPDQNQIFAVFRVISVAILSMVWIMYGIMILIGLTIMLSETWKQFFSGNPEDERIARDKFIIGACLIACGLVLYIMMWPGIRRLYKKVKGKVHDVEHWYWLFAGNIILVLGIAGWMFWYLTSKKARIPETISTTTDQV